MEGLIFGILRYIKQNVDLTKPCEQILSVPWPFVKSWFHCTMYKGSKHHIKLERDDERDTVMPKSGIDHRCLKLELKKADYNGRNLTNIGPIITFISICKKCRFQCLEISLLLYGWDVGNRNVALWII